MVAQNSIDFPIFRGHAKQRGRGTLAQTLARTAIPFLKNIKSLLQKQLE